MSTLHFIRSLRRTLAALREADSPVAVALLARALASELEADLVHLVVTNDQDALPLALASDGIMSTTDDGPIGIEMAVCA